MDRAVCFCLRTHGTPPVLAPTGGTWLRRLGGMMRRPREKLAESQVCGGKRAWLLFLCARRDMPSLDLLLVVASR
ncbi:hypothetical protein COCOR_01930 [Corallococcus coralloides DSM 2259]|uniref:Uncharacterized protein n=1 Tax=Corallococcus coralloides (strain ATCC 25202 / DSM 2259 / NBRC 100086 / M2) TaxID=1144275 RepID=H8MG89_CORCM|nr:hypothetical protein COCOR_01930 [Corallococcus coralloides DSM 2259]